MGVLTDPPVEAMGPEKYSQVENRGNHWKKFSRQVQCAPLTPVGHPQAGTLNLAIRGYPSPLWIALGGGVDTCLVYPHPTTHLEFLLNHPLQRKAS